ncbi:hypothetical protein NHX12_004954 [Muraenolepis orangiensis]|uniref:Afadin-and alpha-actinin-binding protein n=1 Tax=Muraenolepis orangiensis TaxID=630683 RepID=A0A9Q0DXS2_9TELE|nr:hypothetical protein NHX12_004954 [Muraenolepis orangiensis]
MGDWWTTAPLGTSMENHDISSISRVSLSPSRQNHFESLYCSSLPLPKSSHNVLSAFCIEGNAPQCISYINQELVSLGLSMGVTANGDATLNTVPTLNAMYELLQDQLELLKREKSGLHETERQLQLKIKTLQGCLKSEKDEIQKLQSMAASRASQYVHDAKRKERECVKLKERLGQLLIDKRDKKIAIDLLNYLGRSDGKRIQWKTAKAVTGHEGDMYKSMLNDYEARQRTLMLENSELKKVIQQMKRDMMYILSPHKPCSRGSPGNESQERGFSQGGLEWEDEEVVVQGSRESLDQTCEQAREQLTNGIRLQWRRLKNHLEKLDSQVSLAQSQQQQSGSKEAVPREIHEEEMQRMRLEVQECKDFIHTQQQLLQQQLNSSFDEETAALLNDCYTLEEKERLKEEWRLFGEQKGNFERERKNFTEAAIRLGHDKKTFEEDRAAWLKNQFLNMTPFTDRKRYCLSDSQSTLSIRSEPDMQESYTPAKSSPYTELFTPKAATGGAIALPSTTELYRTLHLIPDTRHSKQGSWQESSAIQPENPLGRRGVRCRDRRVFSLDKDGDSSP